MRLLFPRRQTLHQNEGPFGGQVTTQLATFETPAHYSI